MKVPSSASSRNPDIPGQHRWLTWIAVIPAVAAGCIAAWMFDWPIGITVANGVLSIAGQLAKRRGPS